MVTPTAIRYDPTPGNPFPWQVGDYDGPERTPLFNELTHVTAYATRAEALAHNLTQGAGMNTDTDGAQK